MAGLLLESGRAYAMKLCHPYVSSGLFLQVILSMFGGYCKEFIRHNTASHFSNDQSGHGLGCKGVGLMIAFLGEELIVTDEDPATYVVYAVS